MTNGGGGGGARVIIKTGKKGSLQTKPEKSVGEKTDKRKSLRIEEGGKKAIACHEKEKRRGKGILRGKF